MKRTLGRTLRRFADDLLSSWTSMPKKQALRWYCSVLMNVVSIIKTRKLVSADTPMRGILKFYLLGRNFYYDMEKINSTPGAGYTLLRELFVRKLYVRAFDNINFSNCIDIGCNIGLVSYMLRCLAGPKGRVIAVDAQEYSDNAFRNYLEMTSDIIFNHRVICGKRTREDKIKLQAVCEPLQVDPKLAESIESVLERHGMERVNFLKMDIEGAEFDIFMDAPDWLNRVDNLAMEVHPSCGNPLLIIQTLRRKDFQVAWCDEFGYASSPKTAGFIYASSVGGLRKELRSTWKLGIT